MIQKVKSFLFENNSTKQTIIKNTFWSGASQILCALIKASFVFYVARILGAAEYGRMNAALSFSAIFLIFSDLGVSTIALREIGRDASEERVNDLFSLRFFLNFFAFVLTLIAALFYGSDFFMIRVIWAFALFNLLTGATAVISSYFSAKQHAQYSAFFDLANAIIATVLGFSLLRIHATAAIVAVSYCLGAAFSFVGFVILFRTISSKAKLRFDWYVWREILVKSFPFAITGTFAALCANIDIFIMGAYRQYEAIGFYSSALKVASVATIPMGLIAASFLPALNNLFHENKEKYNKVVEAEFEVALVLSLAIACGGNILAGRIIDFVYDQRFIPAITTLKVFLLLIIPIFLTSPLAHIMIIEDKQKHFMQAWAINFATNALLDLLLIPKIQHLGGAIATICANTLFIFYMYFRLQNGRSEMILTRRLFYCLVFSATSCWLMSSMIAILSQFSLHLTLIVALSGLSYLAAYALQRRLFLGSFTG